MILDTAILVAAADRGDRHHRQAAAIFALPDPKLVTEPVVVETGWALQRYLSVDAEIAFLEALNEGGIAVESPKRQDRVRAADLLGTYRDARLGYVDAVTIAIAERLDERRIATLDRRDYSLVRPRHIEAFELVP